MSTELYIARRLSLRRGGSRPGVMERVATTATAISLAVVIVTLSVVVGFKQDIRRILSSTSADIVVTAPQSRGVVSAVDIERSMVEDFISSDVDVVRYSPYRAKEGVVKSDDNVVGVLLKGIDSLYHCGFLEQHLIAGRLPRVGVEPRSKDILLSESIARKMDVEVGDRVEMLFLDGEGGLLRDRFELSGIYRTGIDVVDDICLYTDMGNVARLYDRNTDRVTGYELWLAEGADSKSVAMRLNDLFVELYFATGCEVEAFTAEQIFPHVYGWLSTHDVNAVVIIVIVLVVALLNMTTSLLIIVLERQRMIGELRAMGMTRRGVERIFLWRAIFILCRGVAWGVVVGLLLVVVQYLTGIVPLPAEGYMLDHVPVALCWGWWLVTVAGVVFLAVVTMLLPATLAARVSPSDTMKYE